MLELKQKRKKLIYALLIFMGFMWFFTITSKSIYASKLPRVSTENPTKKFIEHHVKAEGVVIQGGEKAVTAPDGMRVENILVHIGDVVEEGSKLLQVDMEDLSSLIRERETAIKTMQFKIADLETNKLLKEQKRQILEQRAKEDYNSVYNESGTTLGRAEESRDKAQNKLKEHLENPTTITGEEERKKAWDRYENWVSKGKELNREISETKKKIADLESTSDTNTEEDKAELAASKERLKLLSEELSNHDKNSIAEPDFSNEDSAKEAFQAETRQLEEGVKNAGNSTADAQIARNKSLLEAQRALDDINFSENADSTLEIYNLELTQMKSELTAYKKIQAEEGYVKAEVAGMITNILTGTGGRIPDTAVMLMTDDSVPYRFKTTIEKEQKKYVNMGDTVNLTLDDNSLEGTVDYVAESQISQGSYELYCNLPEGSGIPGMSAVLEATVNGEPYSCVIPAKALLKEDMRYYIYLLKEREGILGTELYAEKINVTVLDQNEKFAALEEIGVDQESKIIVDSSDSFVDGAVVRPEE